MQKSVDCTPPSPTAMQFLSRFWVSKWHPKILQSHPKFWKPRRYDFALYWRKTIWGKHVFLHVAVSTATAMIGWHNSLQQNLEAEIMRIASVHCHAHRLNSACCYTAADLYSVRKCESTLIQWKGFTVSPLRSACLAMHFTIMKTKGRQLWHACKTRCLSSEVTMGARSAILAVGPHWSSCDKLKMMEWA